MEFQKAPVTWGTLGLGQGQQVPGPMTLAGAGVWWMTQKSVHSVGKGEESWGLDVTWKLHVSPMYRAWTLGPHGGSHEVMSRLPVFGQTRSPLIRSDLLSLNSSMCLFQGQWG